MSNRISVPPVRPADPARRPSFGSRHRGGWHPTYSGRSKLVWLYNLSGQEMPWKTYGDIKEATEKGRPAVVATLNKKVFGKSKSKNPWSSDLVYTLLHEITLHAIGLGKDLLLRAHRSRCRPPDEIGGLASA